MSAGLGELRIEGRLLRVARPALDGYDSVDDPAALLRALSSARQRVDLLTFMQTLPDRTPRYGYAMEWDNLAALRVSTFDRWWTAQIPRNTRKRVRLAGRRGVEVHEVPFDPPLVAGISAIYDESPVRQGKRFPHYRKDRETVARENGTFLDRSIFLGAYVGEVLVGFAKLVCNREQTQAAFMQILALLEHRDKAPVNALIAHAVRSCAERGVGHLVYGRHTYGRKHGDGLTVFKRHNGFLRVDVPRYYLPLTAIGHAALRLGLHRSLTDRVPERVLRHVRALRERWYARQVAAANRWG